MLIEFEVENYLSFRDKVSFSLEKTLIRKYPEHVFSGKISVLSGATIYGANASGKSNMFSSMKTVVEMINENKGINYLGFPKNKFMMTKDTPTYFSFIFQIEKRIYRYSFSVSFSKIIEEVLYLLDEKKEVKKTIFRRYEGNTNYGVSTTEWYKYRTTTESSLLLPKLKSDGVLERQEECAIYFREVLSFFSSFIFITSKLKPNDPQGWYSNLQKNDFKTYLLDLLKNADFGITDIQYRRINDDAIIPLLKAISMHPSCAERFFLRGEDGNFYCGVKNHGELLVEKLMLIHGAQQFDMSQESEGTLKLIELSWHFYVARKIQRSILFIDELCSSLHPKLVEFLLKGTIQDFQNTKSQIILTSHDLYMLSEDFWRKDQIWFSEKEVSGNSVLTCLSSFDTRHDESVFRGYLNGLYGGLPVLPLDVL